MNNEAPIDFRDQERPAPVGEETEKPPEREEKRGPGVGSSGPGASSSSSGSRRKSRERDPERKNRSSKHVENSSDTNNESSGKHKRSASTQWAPNEAPHRCSGRRGVVSAPDGSNAAGDTRLKSGDEESRHKRTPSGQSGAFERRWKI